MNRLGKSKLRYFITKVFTWMYFVDIHRYQKNFSLLSKSAINSHKLYSDRKILADKLYETT